MNVWLRVAQQDNVTGLQHLPMRFAVRSALALLLASPLAAQVPANGVVTIGTVDSIYSTTLKEQRKYLVYTPPSYRDTTYLPRTYPVLYLLDGDAHFHSVTGLLQFLGTGINGTFVVPEMIVIAIPNTDRMRDMSPTHVETGFDGKPAPGMKTTGGLGNFLQFIKGELIPKVEATYRTAPYRVFVGHSLGGITAIQALYTIPETFNAYVAIDPSLWWDNSKMLKEARARLANPAMNGRTLYVAQANTINAADTTVNPHFNGIAQFDGVAKAYKQPGMRYGFHYYDQDDHGSVPLIAEYDALHFIFDGYKGNLLATLDRPVSVREHFADISKRLGWAQQPPESMVDLLGQVAMANAPDKALDFFRMNVELYPASPNAHGMLATALAAKGDKGAAAAEYRKALEIAPGRTAWKAALDKLQAAK